MFLHYRPAFIRWAFLLLTVDGLILGFYEDLRKRKPCTGRYGCGFYGCLEESVDDSSGKPQKIVTLVN